MKTSISYILQSFTLLFLTIFLLSCTTEVLGGDDISINKTQAFIPHLHGAEEDTLKKIL